MVDVVPRRGGTPAEFDAAIGILNYVVGALVLGVQGAAVALVATHEPRPPDHHGLSFLIMPVIFTAPVGPLFLLAGRAMRRRWELRWVLQLLPGVVPTLLWRWAMG